MIEAIWTLLWVAAVIFGLMQFLPGLLGLLFGFPKRGMRGPWGR